MFSFKTIVLLSLERLVFHIYKDWTEIVYNDSIIFDSGLFLLYSIWYRIIII